MTARSDLLALSDDALVDLANRGILKRAHREVDAGTGPAVTVDADGTVTATFADGTVATSRTGETLGDTPCSCGAKGVCRHLAMLVIAHRATATDPAGTDADEADEAPAGDVVDQARVGDVADPARAWSPAHFDDDQLADALGTRAMTAARKVRRSGYRARVRRATGTDPATVELASCAVRFLVPGELGYARVDAATGARDDAVALAVWAFRTADERDPAAAVVDVEVGGTGGAVTASGTEPLVAALSPLLAEGIVNVGAGLGPTLATVRRDLDRANLRWSVDLLDDLVDQLDAYRDRGARYRPDRAAALAAEAVARHRSVLHDGAAPRTQVLGTEERAETRLRLLRLDGLGARISGDERSRTIEVYLAHRDAGIVLALRRRAEVSGDDELPTVDDLGRRKAGGARLSALASGLVVTESAVRAANHEIRISENRVARTTVTASRGDWDALPPSVLVGDLDAEAARLADLAPSVVRSRVIAESVRAVAVTDVVDVSYRPGLQELRAVVRAPVGEATVVVEHRGATPGAIDAVAAALTADGGPVRYVAGHLRRRSGRVEIEPTAVVAGERVVVPAFASAEGSVDGSAEVATLDPVTAALVAGVDVSADVLHRGARHLPAGWSTRAARAAGALRRAGLRETAAAVDDLAGAVRSADDGLTDRWADTHLRLLVALEQV